jgi:hypothetical protein
MNDVRVELAWGVAALAASFGASAYLYGWFFDTGAVSLGLYDSGYYDLLGRALWQGGEVPGGRFALRGYLFPMFATGLTLISPLLYYLVQSLFVATGVVFLLHSERALTNQIRVTPLALFSISMLLSPSLMMTEAVAFMLAAAALTVILTRQYAVWSVFLLVLAALVKPAFLPVAIVAAMMTLRFDRVSLAVSVLVALVLTPQLVGTYMLNGRAVISSAGQVNFQRRFYPAVVGMAELDEFVRENSDEATAARAKRPELKGQVAYVLGHPLAAVRTWGFILWRYHLREGSGFAWRDNKGARPDAQIVLNRASRTLNTVLLSLLAPGFLGIFVFFRRFSARVWPAALIGPSIFLTAPLVYFQGDRIVFIGFLIMLPFAGLGFSWLWNRWRMTA